MLTRWSGVEVFGVPGRNEPSNFSFSTRMLEGLGTLTLYSNFVSHYQSSVYLCVLSIVPYTIDDLKPGFVKDRRKKKEFTSLMSDFLLLKIFVHFGTRILFTTLHV